MIIIHFYQWLLTLKPKIEANDAEICATAQKMRLLGVTVMPQKV